MGLGYTVWERSIAGEKSFRGQTEHQKWAEDFACNIASDPNVADVVIVEHGDDDIPPNNHLVVTVIKGNVDAFRADFDRHLGEWTLVPKTQ